MIHYQRSYPARLFYLLIFIVAISFSACSQRGTKLPEKPNIIFIMSDDHAYQAISCYDSSLIITPNIDRLAEGGLKFTNSFVCNSICAPSRASLLTGKHSHANGVYDNRQIFDSSQVTFPKLMQDAGYQTAIVGKWHLKSQPSGFDYWNILPGQGQYYNPDFIEMGKESRLEGYVTNLITDISINWLKGRDKDKPFLLMIHNKAPHRNWMPDTAYFDLFKDKEFAVPANFFDDYKGREAAAQQEMSVIKNLDLIFDLKMLDREGQLDSDYRSWFQDMLLRMNEKQRKAWDREYQAKAEEFIRADLEGDDLARWKLGRYLEDYLKCIASVDDNVGILLDYLEQTGLDNNTIVVYTSDQGFYLGEHGWFDKRFMYEESLRMPLLMRVPGAKKQGQVSEMVQNIDFAPTFLDMAGIEIPGEMQGVSMLPVIEGKDTEDWREAIYYHYYAYPAWHSVKKHYGIRTSRYKLIHFYYDIDSWELFDLENDPHEMNNLIADSSYAEIISGLKTRLLDLAAEYGDSLVLGMRE